MSPILFSIYLKKALKNPPSHFSGKEIIYADDVGFVTEEEIDIEERCNTLKKYNLIVNKNKTEIITMKHNSLDNLKFKKLGSILAVEGEKKLEGTTHGCNEQALKAMGKKEADFKEKSKIVQCLHNANSAIQLWNLVIDKN